MSEKTCVCTSTDARRCYENRYMPLMDDFQRSKFDEEQQCDPQECECGCHEVSQLCEFCGADDDCYPVSCARCSAAGCCQSFVPEEGDEWECPPCNRREDGRERGA